MFLPTSYEGFLVVAVGLGIGRGIRTVYWVVVLPDYVPIKKFPSAAAIQSLINGVFLAASGPVIGMFIIFTCVLSYEESNYLLAHRKL